MHINKVKIENFKCFKGVFTLSLNEGLNILVGNNEAGKSTILEAIHLALTGLLNGKYVKNELTQYLFNNEIVIEYIQSIKDKKALPPPKIVIELFMSGADLPIFEGDDNSSKQKDCCITFKIDIDNSLQADYEDFIKTGDVSTIPIDYYVLSWTSCARESITPRVIPIKSAMIDSSNNRYQNGSDVYISHIIKNHLTTTQKIDVSQAHRKMQDFFSIDKSIQNINEEIKKLSKKSEHDKVVKLSVDLTSKNVWENSVLTYVENVPFQYIGKGEQSIVKTKIALEHNKAKEANVILIEEPENHLSHSKLNQLIYDIKDKCTNKQIIISTHSSFVANKLGLESLILLHNQETVRLNDLEPDTINYFEKISGYDTLRLILSKSAILCEGDSDELIIQKAFMKANNEKLPIQCGIDVISVGLSFMRYIEIAEKLSKWVAIVTDNDENVISLTEKYKKYNDNPKSSIKVFFDTDENYPTLEPQLLKINSWSKLNEIIGEKYKVDWNGHKKGDYKCNSDDELETFMLENKTECALKLFDTADEFNIPKYILDAIEHAKR